MTEERSKGRWVVKTGAKLELQLGSSERAQVLWDAIAADDPGSVSGRVEGGVLHIEVGPAPAPTVRTTVDDLLACLQAAIGGVDVEKGDRDPLGVD